MPYATESLVEDLKIARKRGRLSQRDLSARIGVPQSHISKIESGRSDLRLSSLVEIARALDLELTLVPRKLLPAVEAIVRPASASSIVEAQRLSVLTRLKKTIDNLAQHNPPLHQITDFEQVLRELGHFQLTANDVFTLQSVTSQLRKIQDGAPVPRRAEQALRQLRDLRSQIAHAVPDKPRPAYSLDEDASDA